LQLVTQRPTGCKVLGPVEGIAGEPDGRQIQTTSLQDSAKDQLLKRAGELGATHVQIVRRAFLGQTGIFRVEGEAYLCRGAEPGR
jgi:hypothetical protein